MIVLRFHAPGPAVSMNELTRGRGRQAHRAMARWRNAVECYLSDDYALEMAARRLAPRPVDVHLTIPFASLRRRDPINYAATVKPVTDACVRAGIVPGDDPEWVTDHVPALVVDPTLTCILRITDRKGVVPPPATT